MKMKRNMALLLAGCLILAGCGSKASSSAPPDTTSTAVGAASPAAAPATSSVVPPVASQAPTTAEPASSWGQQGYLPQFAEPESGTPVVTLHTSMGDIKMMLFPQAAPKTVESFVTHCKNGYYDGVIFHRVIEGFMIQGGDPLGNGMGGESATGGNLPDEFSDHLFNFRGAVSMANAGYGTGGSQFFVVQEDAAQYPNSSYRVTKGNSDQMMSYIYGNSEKYKGTMLVKEKMATGATSEEMNAYVNQLNTELQNKLAAGLTDEVRARFSAALEQYIKVGGTPSLDYNHTVFGQVIEGMDVVDAIARVAKGANDKPVTDVVIQSTTVEIAK